MKTYQALRNLTAVWTMGAFIAGALIGVIGAIALMRGSLNGLLAIGAAVLLVLTSQTLGFLIDLLIDIALSLQRLSHTQRENPRLPPQLGKNG